ncbi:putative N-acetyltransferase YhbS [Methanohalophilus levihalophilus]|uniref:GNAT family N-acetyltransferase n=1 Tax=Methanohalophilus levihalophilus TaxID=1431282 RepID=UPI001AE51DC3|nr:N-acetyltransferase [Methanohalophilus levihalophilus]MBP2029492.1 putative N-acetyltransferase YhbS [Methanohalophilus levihalophilus]
MLIRSESSSDYVGISKLNDEAFGRPNESKLVADLRKNPGFVSDLSFVAEQDGQIVGHVLFFPITISTPTGSVQSLSIAPLSVLPPCQGQGVGSVLIRAGIDEAEELGYTSVIVVGPSEYYSMFGFEPAGKWNLRCPYDVPDEAFMGLELVENSLDIGGGVVEFPPEYDDAI